MWGEACSVPQLVLPGGAGRWQPPLSPGWRAGAEYLSISSLRRRRRFGRRGAGLPGLWSSWREALPPARVTRWWRTLSVTGIRGCFVPCSTEEELSSQRWVIPEHSSPPPLDWKWAWATGWEALVVLTDLGTPMLHSHSVRCWADTLCWAHRDSGWWWNTTGLTEASGLISSISSCPQRFFHSCPLSHCGCHLSQPPSPDPPSLSSLGTLDWSSPCSPFSTAALRVLPPLLNVGRRFPWQNLFSARPRGSPTSLHSPPIQPAPVLYTVFAQFCWASGPSAHLLPLVVLLTLLHRPVQPFHHHTSKSFHSSESVMLFHTWPPIWWFTEPPNLHSQATKNVPCPMNI